MHNDLFDLLHHWQNPRLAFICPVGCKKELKETSIKQKGGGKSEALKSSLSCGGVFLNNTYSKWKQVVSLVS